MRVELQPAVHRWKSHQEVCKLSLDNFLTVFLTKTDRFLNGGRWGQPLFPSRYNQAKKVDVVHHGIPRY